MFADFLKKAAPAPKVYPENINSLKNLPQEFLTPLVKKYLNQTLRAGGAIVTLRQGAEYLSLAIMQYAGESLNLDYVYTPERHRNRGYAGILLRDLMAHADPRKSVTASLNTGLECFSYAERLLAGLGFQKAGGYRTFIFQLHTASSESWAAAKTRAERICSNLARKGFRCIPFTEASPALLEQVRNSSHNEFSNMLNPAPMFDISGYIRRDVSFVLEKDGKPAAYSILSQVGADSLEFDQISAADRFRNTGAVLAPIWYSVYAALQDKNVKNIIYQIFDQNQDCLRLISHIQPAPCDTEMKINFYRYKIPPA